jgi:cytidylate kinase
VAAGKSTIARLVAKELGYTYIDSGAMYRALAWAAQRRGIGAADAPQVEELLRNISIRLIPQAEGGNQVLVGEDDVTLPIRAPEIGDLASKFSEIPAVRQRLVAMQQEMARAGGVVMEGRDIQTVVLPDAEVKIFLTAPAEERARRRHAELLERGFQSDYPKVLGDVQARDERDSNRTHSPLKAAPDAVHLDSGGLSIPQVVEKVLDIVRAR